MITTRFSLRSIDPSPEARAAQYSTLLDMAVWGETHGVVATVLCQHHAEPKGYLPSPLPVAAAVAARTSTMLVNVAALLVPLYEPVKLAEDLAVIDLISKGRVTYVAGLGYRDEEFAMFGVTAKGRGAVSEETLAGLRRVWAGESATLGGRTVTVTPLPFTRGGPFIALGGGSLIAARRAGRLGMPMIAETSNPAINEAYLAEAERCGTTPSIVIQPAAGASSTVFVADDPDKAWSEIGTYLLDDAMMYSGWNANREGVTSISRATTVEALRAEEGEYRILTPAEARDLKETYGSLNLQPLCSGIPPEVAWRYLEAAADAIS